MVLELIINPKKMMGKPWEFIILGFIYALVSVFLAMWIFKNHVSIVMVTLTIVASIPTVRYIIDSQEKTDLTTKKERKLLKEHDIMLINSIKNFNTPELSSIYSYNGFHLVHQNFIKGVNLSDLNDLIRERVEGGEKEITNLTDRVLELYEDIGEIKDVRVREYRYEEGLDEIISKLDKRTELSDEKRTSQYEELKERYTDVRKAYMRAKRFAEFIVDWIFTNYIGGHLESKHRRVTPSKKKEMNDVYKSKTEDMILREGNPRYRKKMTRLLEIHKREGLDFNSSTLVEELDLTPPNMILEIGIHTPNPSSYTLDNLMSYLEVKGSPDEYIFDESKLEKMFHLVDGGRKTSSIFEDVTRLFSYFDYLGYFQGDMTNHPLMILAEREKKKKLKRKYRPDNTGKCSVEEITLNENIANERIIAVKLQEYIKENYKDSKWIKIWRPFRIRDLIGNEYMPELYDRKDNMKEIIREEKKMGDHYQRFGELFEKAYDREVIITDSHIHSIYSDGQHGLVGLIARFIANDIDVAAITDHDNFGIYTSDDMQRANEIFRKGMIIKKNKVEYNGDLQGLAKEEFLTEMARELGEDIIIDGRYEIKDCGDAWISNKIVIRKGVELTAKYMDEEKGETNIHILGYNMNKEERPNEYQSFLNHLDLMTESRWERGRKLIHHCKRKGYELKEEDLRVVCRGSLSRLNIAATIYYKYGGFKNPVDAMNQLFGRDSKEFTPVKENILSAQDAINMIRSMEGHCVIAHPRLYGVDSDRLVDSMKKKGIFGVEDPILAKKYDLFNSHGSDDHGNLMKPGIIPGIPEINLQSLAYHKFTFG